MSRDFVFSCDLFGGFKCNLFIDDFHSLDEIVVALKQQLIDELDHLGLEYLSILAKAKNYHIHIVTMSELRNIGENIPIYVCSHADKNNV